MGRKRSGERPPDVPVDPDGNTVVLPEANGHAPTDTVEPGATAPVVPPEPPKTRPVATFAALSDRSTRLEVAAWGRTVKAGDGTEVVQYALTVQRSWRDADGKWTTNGSYRAHDVPVLLFLVQQAYHWCLLQRTDITVASDEPLPF